MSEPTDADLTDRELELLERASGYDGSYAARAVAEIRRSRLAALTAAGEESDFLAFMADELDRFPCLHGPAGNGAHAKTAPMMWPELIRCIVAKAKQDAHPATPPPVPAEVVEAGERLQRHETAMATVGPTKSPYWQGHGWIGRPPGEVADLATVARAYVAELVARHVLGGEGT
jgi:hypothetical protein